MSAWIPLFQSLVWPIFLAIFLILVRGYLVSIIKNIINRIEEGASFQAGPSGISLGQSEHKLTRLSEVKDREELSSTIITSAGEGEGSEMISAPTIYDKVTYLVHSVSAPRIDTDNIERRGISVIVDADSEDILDKIERVVYHLHPTFPNPDKETYDRKRFFALNTRAWGEFNLSADIYFKGYEKPLSLCRYLNFPQQ
jgi:hypothetical protein